MTIRQLREEARDRGGIDRYGSMTKEQLKAAIRAVDENPEQQERIRRTLEKRKTARKTIGKLPAAKYLKEWEKMERLAKLAGVDPKFGAAAMGAALIGITTKVYGDLRDRYAAGYDESAEAATVRADKTPGVETDKPNIMFAVGGLTGGNEGSGSQVRTMVRSLSRRQGAEGGDKWMDEANEIAPFDSEELQIPSTNLKKRNANGQYNPAYLGYLAKEGVGKVLSNYQEGRSEAAVELASQIYATARKKGENGRFLNQDKSINILAHGAGGSTAYEAMEVISRMPQGKKVLGQVNLVTMGTPDFGFTRQGLVRETNLTSPQDPLNIFPSRKNKRISAVRGHELEDYLSNAEARRQIQRMFGAGVQRGDANSTVTSSQLTRRRTLAKMRSATKLDHTRI